MPQVLKSLLANTIPVTVRHKTIHLATRHLLHQRTTLGTASATVGSLLAHEWAMWRATHPILRHGGYPRRRQTIQDSWAG